MTNSWDFQSTFSEPLVVWFSVIALTLSPLVGFLMGVISSPASIKLPEFDKKSPKTWLSSTCFGIAICAWACSILGLVATTLFYYHLAFIPLLATFGFISTTKSIGQQLKKQAIEEHLLKSGSRESVDLLTHQMTYYYLERDFLSSVVPEAKLLTLGLKEQWDRHMLSEGELRREFAALSRDFRSTQSALDTKNAESSHFHDLDDEGLAGKDEA